MNRRRFLFKLGALTSTAIVGYVVGDTLIRNEVSHSGSPADLPSETPKLANVRMSAKNGQLILSNEKTTCVVNNTGEFVVKLLDGNNTLYDICRHTSTQFAVPHTDEMEVAIARFICQLGMASLLVSPYYVTFYEA